MPSASSSACSSAVAPGFGGRARRRRRTDERSSDVESFPDPEPFSSSFFPSSPVFFSSSLLLLLLQYLPYRHGGYRAHLSPHFSLSHPPSYRSGAGVVNAPTQGVALALDDRERDVALEGQIGEEEGVAAQICGSEVDVEAETTPILSFSRANRVCFSSFVIRPGEVLLWFRSFALLSTAL